MHESFYDKLHSDFGEKTIQNLYKNTDAFVLSIFSKVKIKDLENHQDIFDFSNLSESHEICSNKNEKEIGNFKIETPKSI